ncbi:MAG: geranylgeranyl reductase family protein [Promethearchaeati archaeon SRVP18_Atabeyarchaeia-1]
MPERKFDVVVVGAGPAGSMAAWSAAKGGARTVLIDMARLPREKLCGGGVNAWVIKKLGIPRSIIERTIEKAQVVAGERKLAPVPWPENIAWRMVMRSKFDHHLANMAVEAGATLMQSTSVNSVVLDSEKIVRGVRTGDKGVILGNVVIGCDGISSTVARTAGFWNKWFEVEHQKWRDRCAYCTEAHYRLPDGEIDERIGNTLYLFYERDLMGYHWIFPKRGILTVGTGSATTSMKKKPLTYFNDFVKGNAIALKLLKGAELIDKVRGAYVPFSGTFVPSYGSGVLLAGDSAGMVGAVTGEGIYFAVRSGIAAGEVASEAAISNDTSASSLSLYEKRWKAELGKHLDIQVDFLKQTQNPLKAMGLYTTYTVQHLLELYP